MARLVGVRADRVIAVAFALSGMLAGFVSLYVVAQGGSVSYKMGVNMVLVAFVASVIGGIGSLPGAALGGFLLGIVSVALQAFLPEEWRPYRDAFVFLALHRLPALAPAGNAGPARRSREGLGMGRIWRFGKVEFATATAISVLLLLVVLAARLRRARLPAHGDRSADRSAGGRRALYLHRQFRRRLLRPCLLHGDRRLCLGHPHHDAGRRSMCCSQLPGFLEHLQLPVAAGGDAGRGLRRASSRWLVGMAFIRLRGIALPMATFAMLMIVHVVAQNWNEVTGGRRALVGLPQFTGLWTALLGAVVALAAAASISNGARGLLLRCSRENEVAAEASASTSRASG